VSPLLNQLSSTAALIQGKSSQVQAGAIFPLRQARFLIDAKLRSSKYKSPEYLDRIMQEWDEKVKPNFSGTEDGDYQLCFGGEKDNDSKNGIVKGHLILSAYALRFTIVVQGGSS